MSAELWQRILVVVFAVLVLANAFAAGLRTVSDSDTAGISRPGAMCGSTARSHEPTCCRSLQLGCHGSIRPLGKSSFISLIELAVMRR